MDSQDCKKSTMSRLVLISDTHTQLGKITIPDGDVLLISGDVTYKGTPAEWFKFEQDLRPLALRFKRIIWTPGNHDYGHDIAPTIVKSATMLHDSGDEFAGLKFWGSGWTPWFWDWNLNFAQGEKGRSQAKRIWGAIPDDTNILITHGPPAGIGDKLDDYGSKPGDHVGCPILRNRLFDLPDLKLHVFGHIHCGYGVYDGADFMMGGTTFVNAASCTEKYKPTNPPIVIDL